MSVPVILTNQIRGLGIWIVPHLLIIMRHVPTATIGNGKISQEVPCLFLHPVIIILAERFSKLILARFTRLRLTPVKHDPVLFKIIRGRILSFGRVKRPESVCPRC